jgi:hypothetical protein
MFLLKTLTKTNVGLCESCRGVIDLQLCYLHVSALLFKLLENRAVKHALTGVQPAMGALLGIRAPAEPRAPRPRMSRQSSHRGALNPVPTHAAFPPRRTRSLPATSAGRSKASCAFSLRGARRASTSGPPGHDARGRVPSSCCPLSDPPPFVALAYRAPRATCTHWPRPRHMPVRRTRPHGDRAPPSLPPYFVVKADMPHAPYK